MKNNSLLLLTFIFSLNSSLSFSQLKNYIENDREISFSYSLPPLKYVYQQNSSGSQVVSFMGYTDESKPGEYSLPKQEIFIALPFYTTASVEIFPEKTGKIKGKPNINPLIIPESDTSVSYLNSEFTNLTAKNKNPLILFKGYLWIKNYYCLHLSVQHYDYTGGNEITELQEVKISIKFPVTHPPKKNIPANTNKPNEDYLSKIIINYNYALPLDKKYYDLSSNYDSLFSWINFNETYVKIATNEDGIYRIYPEDLQKAGVDPSFINPRNFNIILKGKTIPLYLFGAEDGKFESSDFIEFFGRKNWGDDYRQISENGKPYKNYLNRYSDTTVFWLTWDNSIAPNRVDSLSIDFNPTDTLEYYSEVVHYEEDHWLDYSIPDIVERQDPEWKQNETWVWGQQRVGTANRKFKVSDVFPNKNVKAFYKIQSFASNQFQSAHKFGLSLNSDPTVFDTVTINKYQQAVISGNFNSNLLNEGDNTLKTISFPTNATINSVEYDWYEIEYPRRLKAVGDSLKFTIPEDVSSAIKYVKITNLSAGDYSIYKFSTNLKRITKFHFANGELFFADTINAGDKYFVIKNDKIQRPKVYYKKIFANLADQSNSADYILITHSKFINKAQEYLSFIQANYNVKTKLVNVQDIYDQFNYGFFAPEPIKYFLQTAQTNWAQPKPKFVFLVGDASYDYYGNKTKYFNAPKQPNYVPSFGEPASDNWFTIWDSTQSLIQQIFIGRIPVNSNEEFDRYFSRHKNYLSKPFDEFNKKYLLFSSGEPDNLFELQTLKAANDFVQENLIKPKPIGGIARHLYKLTNPIRNFGPYKSEEIERYIGEGGVFISYIGHSGVQIWDNGISDVSQLKNINNDNSLISDWGCSTGKFAEPDIKAFSELFITGPESEAINYNGNSSLGFTSTATLFPKLFYSKILQENITTLAEAHALAKAELINSFGASSVNRIFVLCNTLFGDPIVKLKVPQKPNLKIERIKISSNNTFVDESTDSILIILNYNNLGKVEDENFKISFTDNYKNQTVFSKTFEKNIPFNTDSLIFYLPINKAAGKHLLSITLDSENQVDELNESDNSDSYELDVFSSTIRPMNISNISTSVGSELKFINPILQTASNTLNMLISENESFTNSFSFETELDTFYTKIHFPANLSGKRIWFKTKLKTSQDFGSVSTVKLTGKQAYGLNDSLDFHSIHFENLSYKNGTLKIDSSSVKFKIVSAGLNDGNAIVIEKNGEDFVKENTLRGHFVVLFNAEDFSYVNDYRFDIFGSTSEVDRYINMLDTLDNSYLLLVGIKDEGSVNLTSQLKSKLKEFGSRFIDSLKFRYSWAMIGRKGAAIGSVPEMFTKTFGGKAIVDTTIKFLNRSGKFLTKEFGPAASWKDISSTIDLPSGSSIKIFPIGIRSNGTQDTLNQIQLQNRTIQLDINAKDYPNLKLLGILESNPDKISPELRSIEVNFNSSAELGTNFQAVKLLKDSVTVGEQNSLMFSVFNAGDEKADSFDVSLNDLDFNNNSRLLFKQRISLGSEEKKSFSIPFSANEVLGKHILKISIDEENKILEQYEDNNIYTVLYNVKADSTLPTINLSINGQNIIDGDYVSSTPDIFIELFSPSAGVINDTSVVKIFLNDKPVYYSNTDEINYQINSVNPKFTLHYFPKLQDGKYTLKIIAKSSSSSTSPEISVLKEFKVSSNLELLNVFNYPNPFSEGTYFTFKLSKIPDELYIKIFTVAGREVKKIRLTPSNLNFDFNRIYWNGRDEDGDELGNGTYLYKVIVKTASETKTFIQKLAKIK